MRQLLVFENTTEHKTKMDINGRFAEIIARNGNELTIQVTIKHLTVACS
jgi:hypothetical protein